MGTVTLDLKNHKLIGTGSKQGTALSVQSGSTPLIKSGAIQGWGAGITFIVPDDAGSASGKATITGVTFTGNDVGVAAGGGGLAQRSSLVVPPQMPSGRVIRA